MVQCAVSRRTVMLLEVVGRRIYFQRIRMFLINPLPLLQWNFVMRSIVIFMVQHRHLFRIRMLKHICKCRLTRPDSLCNTSYRSFHSFHLCILFSQRLNALGHAEMGIRADSYNQPQLILLIYILYKTAVNPD